MDIPTQVSPELWFAISNSYQTGNYTNAVKDAIGFLTEVIRDKSGLTIDGVELVGSALGTGGGKPPRIKINKLQTDTEKNIQTGLQEILKGIYRAIRNPRSHEKIIDTKKDADAIISFIDYILGFLGKSQQSYTIDSFISLVKDPYFVKDREYVEGLVSTIPQLKMSDTLIEIYRSKSWEYSENIQAIITAIIKKMDEKDIDEFYSVVSDELQRCSDVSSATLIIKITPGQYWNKVQKMSLIRIESMLLKSLETAWFDPQSGKVTSSEATWLSRISENFFKKDIFQREIDNKLQNADFDQSNFVCKYLMHTLPQIYNESQYNYLGDLISIPVKRGNKYFKDRLIKYIDSGLCPAELKKSILLSLTDLTDMLAPEIILKDGTSFLGKFEEQTNPHPYFGSDEDDFE